MVWLFAALASAFTVEVLVRLPFARAIVELSFIARRSMHVIRSRAISDHFKEKVLPLYSVRLLRITALLSAHVALAMAPIAVLLLVATALGVPFREFLLSWSGILTMTGMAAIYARIRSSRAT